jgi:hypothetical protein
MKFDALRLSSLLAKPLKPSKQSTKVSKDPDVKQTIDELNKKEADLEQLRGELDEDTEVLEALHENLELHVMAAVNAALERHEKRLVDRINFEVERRLKTFSDAIGLAPRRTDLEHGPWAFGLGDPECEEWGPEVIDSRPRTFGVPPGLPSTPSFRLEGFGMNKDVCNDSFSGTVSVPDTLTDAISGNFSLTHIEDCPDPGSSNCSSFRGEVREDSETDSTCDQDIDRLVDNLDDVDAAIKKAQERFSRCSKLCQPAGNLIQVKTARSAARANAMRLTVESV